jgi:hypothetical protein
MLKACEAWKSLCIWIWQASATAESQGIQKTRVTRSVPEEDHGPSNTPVLPGAAPVKKSFGTEDGVESVVRRAKVAAIKARGDVLLGGPSLRPHHVPLPFTAKIIQQRLCGSLDLIRLGLGPYHPSGKLSSRMSCAFARPRQRASCAMTACVLSPRWAHQHAA